VSQLLLASVLWAFSFGLIARELAGVDSAFVATVRLGLAALVFLPFLRPGRLPSKVALGLVALGALQYGLMYLCYIESYRYLAGHEVALLTALTPLHVVLVDGLLRRNIGGRALAGAGLAVAGALVIGFRAWGEGGLVGVGLVQAANLCFALGQVLYARWFPGLEVPHRALFAWLYLGAFGLAATALVLGGGDPLALAAELSASQVLTLAYLGPVAAGLGFYLWNVGATRVEAGTLAVFNNVKVPLAVVVALWVFQEDAHLLRLLAGSLLIVWGLSLTLAGSRLPTSRP
jgi:drug/metabolite transporter (DMT)-like permease